MNSPRNSPRPAHRAGSTATFGLFLLVATAAAQTGPASWTTARHDLRRTARSPVVAARTATLRHAPHTTGSSAVPSTAAQGPSGNVSFSNGGALRTIEPHTGTTAWSVAATAGRKFSAPAIGPDGGIHAVQTGGNLPALIVALNEDGTQRWVHTTSENVAYASDLAVDSAGRVFGRYLETQFTAWHAFALDPAGGITWKTSVPYASEFDPKPPAMLSGGDLVLTATDAEWNDRLMRFDADTGAIVWSVVPGGLLSGPVVGDNGLVLLHSPGHGIRAFSPDDGGLVWSVPYFAQEYGEDNPPVLLPGGEIVAIANGDALGNRLVYRISPDGVLLGTVPFPSTGYYTKSASGGDGTLYVWTSMRLMAFSPLSGTVLFEYYAAPTSSCLKAPQVALLADGSIFASWQRRQTCNSPSAFGEFVTIADPSPGASHCVASVAGVSACPCANPPLPADRGCDNSSATGGAWLASTGLAQLSSDTLMFNASGLKPAATSVLLQGDLALPAGAPFGQGVRCVAGSLKRLYTKVAEAGVVSVPVAGEQAVSERSAALGDTILPGMVRYYLMYYRDPIVLGGCPAASTFNASQSQSLAWGT